MKSEQQHTYHYPVVRLPCDAKVTWFACRWGWVFSRAEYKKYTQLQNTSWIISMNIYVSYVIFIPNAECLYCYLGGRNDRRYETKHKTRTRELSTQNINFCAEWFCLIWRSVADGFEHETKIKRSAFLPLTLPFFWVMKFSRSFVWFKKRKHGTFKAGSCDTKASQMIHMTACSRKKMCPKSKIIQKYKRRDFISAKFEIKYVI